MKTITINTLNVVEKADINNQPEFNRMVEQAAVQFATKKAMTEKYGRTLTKIEQLVVKFRGLDADISVVAIETKTAVRKARMVKQVSAVAKRARKKVVRATKGLFTSINIFNVMETKAAELCRRVGINPTSTPVLELMAITVEEAAFLFNTQELCQALQLVVKLAVKNLTA